MTTDDMKSAWFITGNRLGTESGAETIMEEFRYRLPKTSLDRLLSRYRRFATIGLICVPLSIAFTGNGLFQGNIRWIMMTLFMLYFLTAALMDLWLYFGINKINIQTMPVSEVIRLARYYRKRHLQFVCILLPVMIIVLGLFLYFIEKNQAIIYGIIFGGCVGLAIGLNQLLGFMRDYKNLT